jgi:2-polyprenyl-3-methyl-5-hydroxy-6-metoxy-1,4-benzoquinol methylase
MELPSYAQFRAACEAGLSVVRPLSEKARERDPEGWNFGAGWPPSHAAYGRMRTLATLQRAVALAPRRALEVAAGDGSMSACLAALGVDALANDLREGALRESMVNFINGDALKLVPGNVFELDPAVIGEFDLVISCEIIEHVAHPDRLLRHLGAFLAPGGRLLLTTPNGSYLGNRLPVFSMIEDDSALEQKQFRPDADGHLFLLTAGELAKMAAEANLLIESLDFFGTPLLTGHGRLGGLRSSHLAAVCYAAERSAQRWPRYLKEKFCFGIMAQMRRTAQILSGKPSDSAHCGEGGRAEDGVR